MFSGSVIVIAILMVLQAQSSTTTTTISVNSISGSTSASSSSENPSATISPVTSTGSSTTTNPSTVSSTAATATTINPTVTSQQTVSTTPVISSSTPVYTTEKPTTETPSGNSILAQSPSSTATETSANTATINPTATMMLTNSTSVPVQPNQTCGNINIELKTSWKESYTNSSSDFHAELRISLKAFFIKVNISVLLLIQKGKCVILKASLCVVVKNDDAGFIEDKIAKDGKIGNITVVEGSLTFTALGVQLSDFKAKDGECGKCSEGGAGPIVIERECKANSGYSCKGVKTTKETNDCVTYCDSSAVAMSGISTLILGMGVLLSTSLIIWE